MSEDKQTFTDPDTGEEVESTWLARWISVPIGILFIGLLTGLDYLFSEKTSPPWWGLGLVLLYLLVTVLMPPKTVERARDYPVNRWSHDAVARTQHRRRILRSQDDQAVPDTAISRAQPPGEPEPTDTALSIADDHDEPNRLTVSEETAETTVEHIL